MKSTQKIIYRLLVAGLATGLVSCEQGFEEINQPYKDASVATTSVPGLFNGLAKNITNEDNTLYVSLFYPLTNQQAVQNTLAPYLNYTSSLWNSYYPSLYNYKALIRKIDEQENPALFDNVRHMATILIASKTLHMLDYYGDIPYSQAASADQGVEYYRPAYDNQVDIYKSVLADLKVAVDGVGMAANQTSIGASESFLQNDFDAWKKFANALRLRYAVRLYDKEQALASEIITDVIGGNKPLPNNQNPASLLKDNYGFWPMSVSPAIVTERQWYTFRERSVSRLRLGTNMWNQMSSSDDKDGTGIYDPRCYVFFQTNNADEWIAQPHDGSSTDGGDPYNGSLTARQPIGEDPDNRYSTFNFYLAYDQWYFPYLIITEADVHFLKAEIYQRGMGIAQNTTLAKQEYEAGITASVDFWYAYAQNSQAWGVKPTPPTDAEMEAFLTNPDVAYDGSNNADALTKIATQAWIATLFEPAEAWAIVRRTGLTPLAPGTTRSTIYKLPYPDAERINNNANWMAVTGGAEAPEQTATKVYWMP
ncbi:SusD/RagB family nutrient-binding outer membrane lipoprotein [Parapedobacter koreensis]|uniref:Starch-binding associating with outer membrane n=1 Tax=Parapedobacter koreensis TaxID=332977 RepID=A0A1H7S850_9SPHI|nr:SusD/RagB family nutrient-binding outer membrane lipoprotein [Parapedobacter koreensis]SEL67914.1 Starch-binding associating with outer membrane [Parapedobacter koreensis]